MLKPRSNWEILAALPLINQIRTRAANSTALVKKADGSDPSNYRIDIYQAWREYSCMGQGNSI